ncbi:MAG: hypothetical protein ACE5DQ_01625 [Candidatus Paceibacterota bacterium]
MNVNRETVIAIILGAFFGVAIAISIIFFTRHRGSDKNIISSDVTPTIAIDTKRVEPLTIDSPKDKVLVSTPTATLKGKAIKGSLIVIQTPTSEQTLKLDSESFSSELELTEGENSIKVSAYHDTQVDTRSLTIYYINDKPQ